MSIKKRHTPETIILKLRQAGKTISEVSRKLEITDATYYKWRKEYGGLQISQAKR